MSARLRFSLLLGVLLLLASAGRAQEPQVRVSMSGKAEAWVGQRLTLVVELLVPGYFAGSPAFDLPSPPGLLLLPPEGRPIIGSETTAGVAYTVQRHEIGVIAEHPGAFTLPPFDARLQFKRRPLDRAAIAATVRTLPISLTVKAPPGAERLGHVISARGLRVEETWQPKPGTAKAGDAFTRRIIFTAPEVPAMVFPAFPVTKIDGLGVYPTTPEVLDHTDRGQFLGERHDSITYVCQRPGRFTIPPARLTWYDLDPGKLQTIDFPAQQLEVLAPPTAASAADDEGTRDLLGGLLAAVAANAFAFALWAGRSFLRALAAPFCPVHLAPLNPLGKEPPM